MSLLLLSFMKSRLPSPANRSRIDLHGLPPELSHMMSLILTLVMSSKRYVSLGHPAFGGFSTFLLTGNVSLSLLSTFSLPFFLIFPHLIPCLILFYSIPILSHYVFSFSFGNTSYCVHPLIPPLNAPISFRHSLSLSFFLSFFSDCCLNISPLLLLFLFPEWNKLQVAKDYCKLDFLTQPMLGCKSNQMRQLLMEGSNVKLKDSGTSGKIDVYLFLFTDLLLICKKSSVGKKSSHVDKVKVIRPPFLVDRLIPANNITEVSTSSTSGSGGEKSSHHTSSSHHHHHSSSSFSSSIANQLSMIYLNEFGVVSSMFILFTSDARSWLEQLKKAQTKYSEAKQRASHSLFITGHQASSMSSMSIQTPFIYRSTTTDEDDESLLYDHPQQILLLTSGYSPRSSRSSLFHSHSGSVEMPGSEGPSIMGSNLMLQVPPPAAPPQTPTNVVNVSQYNQHLLTATGTLTSCYSISSQQPSRARSFELGELRNPSLSVDAEAFGRSHSMETRGSPSHHVVSVVTSSTNNTGLLSTAKLLSTSNTSTSGGGCNNQQSSPPTQLQQQSSFSSSPSSTRISVKPPPPKVPPRKPLGSGAGSLQRCISPIKKPPLLKTKNIEPSPLQSSASLQHSASSASTTTGSSIQQHSPTEKIIIKKEE